jgi:hypothetical protein
MSTIEADTESSLQTHGVRHFATMAGDSGLPESYHLDGGGNFGVWAYRMKILLQKDGRYHYCLTPPSQIMSEEERIARQQVMSIINSNAKNNALKLLRRYNDHHKCWTGLKTRYESDNGPRRVMLIEKFFSLPKTKSISMDAHLTEVKEIVNLLEEVDVNIPEDIIVYYTLKNLPKEYEIFKRMQIAAQKLPTYEQLEVKLISKETSIKMEHQNQEDGEAFLLHRDRLALRRPQPTQKYGHFSTNARHHQRQDSGGPLAHRFPAPADSGGSSGHRSAASTESGSFSNFRPPSQRGHFDAAQRSASNATSYQPRFRSKGLDRHRNNHCNLCGIEGHFERECDLRSILDRIKDYEHRLLERRHRNLNGQVHNLKD